ncbi:hypothetical protein BH11VER1_BH11VER1_29870 [soil metagenome]
MKNKPAIYLSAHGLGLAAAAEATRVWLKNDGWDVLESPPQVARTPDQCRRAYGPSLRSCDTLLQLIGMDCGSLLVTDDEEKKASPTLWEAKEANKLGKTVRRIMLAEDFPYDASLTASEVTPQRKRFQSGFRHKLASQHQDLNHAATLEELLGIAAKVLKNEVAKDTPIKSIKESPVAPILDHEVVGDMPATEVEPDSVIESKSQPEPVIITAGDLKTLLMSGPKDETADTKPAVSVAIQQGAVPETENGNAVVEELSSVVKPLASEPETPANVIVALVPQKQKQKQKKKKTKCDAPSPKQEESGEKPQDQDREVASVAAKTQPQAEISAIADVEVPPPASGAPPETVPPKATLVLPPSIAAKPLKTEYSQLTIKRYKVANPKNKKRSKERGASSDLSAGQERENILVTALPRLFSVGNSEETQLSPSAPVQNQIVEIPEVAASRPLIRIPIPVKMEFAQSSQGFREHTGEKSIRREKRTSGLHSRPLPPLFLPSLQPKGKYDTWPHWTSASTPELVRAALASIYVSVGLAVILVAHVGWKKHARDAARQTELAQASAAMQKSPREKATEEAALKRQQMLASSNLAALRSRATRPQAVSIATAEVKPGRTTSAEEIQTQLEARLETAIAEMRRSEGGLVKYAATHMREMQQLQMQFRSLMSNVGARESSNSPVMLHLAGDLAMTHLLGAQHQTARNILLDSREAALQIHQEDDAELRLANHLLQMVAALDSQATGNQVASQSDEAANRLLMTPSEIKDLRTQFEKSPIAHSSVSTVR